MGCNRVVVGMSGLQSISYYNHIALILCNIVVLETIELY